jgi:hypothetical protein
MADDLEELKKRLLKQPVQGEPLGKNLYIVRLAIESKGKGKSAGARVITWVKLVDNKIVLVAIYDKSEQGSMSIKDLIKLLNG